MRKAYWTYGILAAASLSAAVPAAAQSIQIGRDGVRLVPPQEMRDQDRDHRRDERHVVRDEISERDAIRIARRQGLHDVEAVTKTRSTYKVAGIDRRGNDIRVDIDRDSGAVIRVR
ncbi:PepSY domain-containing protein [Jiella sonneratiae]|uniref:PepSY domain-containing protein n=1 Tax=Jiella sonneratiae TaxID=2816856 RepID=A0ABS3J4U8_9HYPH|nr:PepSY domain-containing protein [Jiella sonneratiae]MBO0904696.1 PepSY domain-containing protein [Jiella sonneratiae]